MLKDKHAHCCCTVCELAGLWEALSNACLHLTAQLQQPNLPAAKLENLRRCGSSVLRTWRWLVVSRHNAHCSNWLLNSKEIAATVAPVAGVAFELIVRQSRSAVAAGKAGRDSYTLHISSDADLLMSGVAEAFDQLEMRYSNVHISSGAAERLAAAWMSDELYRLGVLMVACVVRQQRKEQRGRSQVQPVARNTGSAQLPVPDHHTGESKVLTESDSSI
jgi:hypothetical protein